MNTLARFASYNPYLSGLLGSLLANLPLVDWLGLTLLNLTGIRGAGRAAFVSYALALMLAAFVWYQWGYLLAALLLMQGLFALMLFRRGKWHLSLPGIAVISLLLLAFIHFFPPRQMADALIALTLEYMPVGGDVQLDESLLRQYVLATLPPMLVAVVMLIVLFSLVLARWLQSIVESPGGFVREFQHLRLSGGHWLVWLLLLLLAYGQLGRSGLAVAQLPLALFCLSALYGLPSGTGSAMGRLGRKVYWLLLAGSVVACLYSIPEPMLALATVTLLVDSLFDFRGRRLVAASQKALDGEKK